jgi:hypothetical protein
MLRYYPEKRATAQTCLRSRWLKLPPNLDFKMAEPELLQYFQRKKLKQTDEVFLTNHEAFESDFLNADGEDNEYEDDSNDERDNPNKNLFIPNRYAIDRSFYAGGYIGYGDGIKLDELDHTANWQFEDFTD